MGERRRDGSVYVCVCVVGGDRQGKGERERARESKEQARKERGTTYHRGRERSKWK